MKTTSFSTLLLLSGAALAGLSPAAYGQCSGPSTTIYWVHSETRTSGNNVLAWFGTQIVGDYSDFWNASVSGSQYVGATLIDSSSASVGYNGNDLAGTLGTFAGWYWNFAPSTYGAGTYSQTLSHQAQSACGDNDTQNTSSSLTVNTPTITGFLSSNNGFWNLGPGTSDPQETTGGIYYYQSFVLTFNSNCNPGDTCTDTPSWSFSSSNNQATISTTSGATVTIGKGSSQGNCAYDSTVSANIGGFSSGSYAIDANSPTSLAHTSEETVPWTYYGPGYTTLWRFAVHDACSPYNVLLPIPISENFPGTPQFSQINSGSGYDSPLISNWDYTNWVSSSEFADSIGQSGTSQSLPVGYDVPAPPYSGSIVYFHGAHTFNAGSMTTGDGFGVYSGTIEYYTDHGDNNP